MKGKLYVLGLAGLLMALILGAVTVRAFGASQGQDEPVDVVEKAIGAIERMDLVEASGYFCDPQESLLTKVLESGVEELEGMGIDLGQLLDAVEIDFEEMQYEEQFRDDEAATVRIQGTLALDVDTDVLKPFLKTAAGAAGEVVSDELLDAAMGVVDAIDFPDVPLEGEVELVNQDGKWVLCDDLAFHPHPGAHWPMVPAAPVGPHFDLGDHLEGIDWGGGEIIRGSGAVIREERAVSGFQRVALTGAGDVIITQGDAEALTVEADDNLMAYIETEVSDGTLSLGFTREVGNRNVRPSEKIRFHVTVKAVDGLDLLGAGDFVGTLLQAERLEVFLAGAGDVQIDGLEAVRLEVVLAGAGDVRIDALEAEKLVVKLNGAGSVELAGHVVEQGIYVNGAGDYRAGDLESQGATVELNGVGNARVWVRDTLDVRIPGVGSVAYYGSPQVTKEISMVGRLVDLGDR
jgi:hypothetical protein